MQGVKVTIDGEEGITDENGKVTFVFPTGIYDWSAMKEGYIKSEGQINLTEDKNIPVVMEKEEVDYQKVGEQVSKQIQYDWWVAWVEENIALGKKWYDGLPYEWWYGYPKPRDPNWDEATIQRKGAEQFYANLFEHLNLEEPLWFRHKYQHTYAPHI